MLQRGGYVPSRPSTTSPGRPQALPGRICFSCPGCSASTEMSVRHQPKRLFGFIRNRCTTSSEIAVRHTPKWLFVFARDTHTWCASQPPHRIKIVRAFTTWAIERKAMPPLDVPAGRGIRPVAPIERDHRWVLARWLLHTPDIDAADRVAGALVIIYAQQLTRINRLAVSDL